MILRRYMTNQIASTTFIVLGFLVFLLLGGRLIRYFGIAAEGNLDIGLLFSIIGYNLPYFLELIVPLAFFIALMLVFGRLYVDNEMAIVNSAGMSRGYLARLIAPCIILLFIAECWLSIVGKPWGVRQSDAIWEKQALQSAFDLIQPGEFISNGNYHLYVGSLSDDNSQLDDVILIQTAENDTQGDASQDKVHQDNASQESQEVVLEPSVVIPQQTQQASQSVESAISTSQALPPLPIALTAKDTLILAKSAKQVTTDASSGKSQLDLFNGRRYTISAYSRDYNQVSFGRYRITLTENTDKETREQDVALQPFATLLETLKTTRDNPQDTAQIQAHVHAEIGYRLILPWLIILAPMFALPLAQVRPRQGRWLKLVPAILLFVCVALSIISLKKPIAEEKIGVWSYPLLVIILITLALCMNWSGRINQRIRYRFKRQDSPSLVQHKESV